jgi:hypothetical protein
MDVKTLGLVPRNYIVVATCSDSSKKGALTNRLHVVSACTPQDASDVVARRYFGSLVWTTRVLIDEAAMEDGVLLKLHQRGGAVVLPPSA